MAFEKDLVVRERNWPLTLGLALLCIAIPVAYFFGDVTSAPVMALSLVLGLAGGFAFGAWSMNFGGWRRRRRIVASRDGVSVDGKLVVPSSAIRSARFIPDAKQPLVRLGGEYARALFVAQVTSQDEGLLLIQALGHDAANRKERFQISSEKPFRGGALAGMTSSILAALAIVGLKALGIAPSPQAMMALILLVLVPSLAFALRRLPTAEIGVDGVLITKGRKHEWIPFREVRTIETNEGKVRFVLSETHVDVLFYVPFMAFSKAAVNGRDTFLIRAREALAAHQASSEPRELAARLARADRDKDVWLATLRGLRDGEAGYRASPVRDEELWRVVEDPGAPEDARAAAAFILRRPGEQEAHAERLRIAAQVVAAPRLRVVLESDDEAALEAYCSDTKSKRTMTT